MVLFTQLFGHSQKMSTLKIKTRIIYSHIVFIIIGFLSFLFYLGSLIPFSENFFVKLLKIFIVILIICIFVLYTLNIHKLKFHHTIYFILFFIMFIIDLLITTLIEENISIEFVKVISLFFIGYIITQLDKKILDKYLLIYAYMYLILSIVTIILSIKGVIPLKIVTFSKLRVNFGFIHINHFSLIIFSSLLVFLYKKKIILFILTFLYFIILSIFFTKTRSFLYGFIASAIIVFFVKELLYYTPNILKKYIIQQISIILIIAGFFITLFSRYLLENFPLLDEILSWRLSYYYQFINSNSFNFINFIFGNTYIENIDTFILDSLYLRLIESIGFHATVIFFLLNVAVLSYLIKNKKWIEVFIILNILIIGIIEQILIFSTFLSYFYLYIFYNNLPIIKNYGFKSNRLSYANNKF